MRVVFHRSERLLLRPIWPEDWRGILGGIADEGVVRNLSRAPWPYGEADARKFASLSIGAMTPRFIVSRAADAALVGCIGIDALDDRADVVELGYWIARDHWGRGYATEAGRAVLEIARTLGHTQIIASHFLDNPASGRVLEKLGFAPTGRTVMRHSCGRDAEAETREYALDLGALKAPVPVAA
ncbi:MAG: GNAT family N-acetyltransferase [Pseudomonadota bacterium]